MVKDAAKLLIPDRNIVTVETFRNGKLRQRAKTHNMITQPGLDWLKYKRDYGLNTGIAAGKNTHNVPLDYFNTLVALKDSTAPTIGENYNLSDVIAWANKTAYTGTDTKRGTVNLAESYCTDKLIHWVIDFPTHAGNLDTINSIAWHYYDNNNALGGAILDLIFDDPASVPASIGSYGYKWGDNSNIYALEYLTTAGANLYIYKINLSTKSIAEKLGPFTKPATDFLNSFIIINDAVYFNEYNGSNYKKVYVLNINTGLFTTYTRTTASSGLAYDGVNFWGIIPNNLVKYNPNFSNKDLIPITFSGTFLTYDPLTTNFYSKVGNVFIKFDVTGNILLSQTLGNNAHYPIIIDNTIYQRFYANIFKSQGARALLPVPIQKTAADTMRITYDFDIRY